MELSDRVIVVTGGGSGIGAAMCRRFAVEAPTAIVVVDINGDAAASVADDVREAAPGTEVTSRAIDVADEAQVGAMIAEVFLHHGRLDLFCANAGIGTGMGVEAPDPAWEQIWHVNVMAHVYVARALLPAWLEAGEGHLLITASAAGLLTNLEMPPTPPPSTPRSVWPSGCRSPTATGACTWRACARRGSGPRCCSGPPTRPPTERSPRTSSRHSASSNPRRSPTPLSRVWPTNAS